MKINFFPKIKKKYFSKLRKKLFNFPKNSKFKLEIPIKRLKLSIWPVNYTSVWSCRCTANCAIDIQAHSLRIKLLILITKYYKILISNSYPSLHFSKGILRKLYTHRIIFYVTKDCSVVRADLHKVLGLLFLLLFSFQIFILGT